MAELVTIFEYDKLCTTSGLNGIEPISPEAFDSLETFLADLNQRDEEAAVEMHEVFRLSSHRGHKTLQARNYVGIVSTGDTTIEILPKIGRLQDDVDRTRSLFLAMLSMLRDTPFKNLGQAALHTQNIPILEVFIALFLDEVQQIIKRGICSDYLTWEDNERFVKGRINFSEHLRRNHADQSHIYVEYDLYHVDRPENRLLKSGLLAVARQSHDSENRRRIKMTLDYLTEVNASFSPRNDFAACKNDRNLHHYTNALAWCRIFLRDEAPTSFPGSIVTADALLFPMDRVFEDYIAGRLQQEAGASGFSISIQEQRHSLFETPRKYPLRPDLAIRRHDMPPIILDTKWKLPPNGKPAHADMYQMFAYAAKYHAQHVILIYPSKDSKSGPGTTYQTQIGDQQASIHAFEYALPSLAVNPNTLNADGCCDLMSYISELAATRTIC